MNNITTVISFCTNDFKWLFGSIHFALQVSNEVLVGYYDKLFDGTPEDIQTIQWIKHYYKLDKRIKFFDVKFTSERSVIYNHNVLRITGSKLATNDWVLHLDCDEFVDPSIFNEWWTRNKNENATCYQFDSYWYFRDINIRAIQKEDLAILINKSKINLDQLYSEHDRHAVRYINGFKKAYMENPPIHHYSWVRTKEEMLKKVKAWGHAKERNWVALVEEEFSRPFNGTDFVHGYKFEIL